MALKETDMNRGSYAAAAAVALAALIGALLDIRLLASGISASIPMAPATALAVILLAAALHPELPWSRSRRARLGLLLPVFLLASPSLAVFTARCLEVGWQGIAGLKPFDPWTHLWEMSPLTAGHCFVMGAAAAVFLARERRLASPSAAWGATLSGASAAVILLGYLYGVPLFYGGRVIPMAATTAGCFLLLATALLGEAGRGLWPWNIFEGDSPRALMMRAFLPLIAGIILLMGFMDTRMAISQGTLLSAVLLLGSLLCLVPLVVRISAHVGAAIESAERRLRASAMLNRSLLEHLPQRMFVKDRNSLYLFCNSNYALDLGIRPAHILGKDDFAFFPRELAEGYRADDRAVMAEGKAKDIEERYTAAGKELWIHTLKVPYRDERGEIVGVLGLFEDITERRRSEQRLKLFRELLDHSSDGIEVLEVGTLRLLDVNRKSCDDLGYTREELLEMTIFDIDPGVRPDLVERRMREIAEAGSTLFEAEHRRKDGSMFPVEVSLARVELEQAYLVATVRDITERKRSEAELERLRMAIEQADESIIITDHEGTILFVNPAFEALSGYSRQEALGKTPRLLKSGQQDAAFYRELWATISSGRTWKGRLVNKRKDGTLRTEAATISPVRDSDGRIINYVAVKRDVTEYIRLEGELRQSQKMESVGRLAGGVAHDFNNILTVINGYAGLALAGLPEGDQRREDLKEVLAAGDRATRLTRQLLAFSRKQILNPQVLDINAVVGATVNMLRRIIGEDIKLETRPAAHPCLAKVDAGQLEQVFLNLAINARDAMPKGGTLTFETGIAAATETFLSRHPAMPPGPLVCLSVRDTGCGMTEEVMAHLFDPFYTTKEMGKGTGLGLSMVYGVIKQSGGDIEVESAPGRGTTFRIYFPQTEAQPQDVEEDKVTDVIPGGNETVLLVEDEYTIRRLVMRTLTASGYTVLIAADAEEALRVLERHGRAVDLLITDVVMPGMNGRELAREIASKNMVRRTLFISGFTEDAIGRHGVLEPGLAFIYKPFSPAAMLSKMREILDGPADKAKA